MSMSAGAQDEKTSKKLPPIKELPKVGESKVFFELPSITTYQVYDQMGKEIMSGKTEFIDMTNWPKGVYFIRHNDKTEKYELK
jgi:hypothetical protein